MRCVCLFDIHCYFIHCYLIFTYVYSEPIKTFEFKFSISGPARMKLNESLHGIHVDNATGPHHH